jgi:hypothetical protein
MSEKVILKSYHSAHIVYLCVPYGSHNMTPFMEAFSVARHTTSKCRPFGRPFNLPSRSERHAVVSYRTYMAASGSIYANAAFVYRPLTRHHCCQPLCRITSVQLRGSLHSSETVSAGDG